MVNKKGIYCLVFKNIESQTKVGSLGDILFRKGWHIYVGSALGNAGYSRVERHRRLGLKRDKNPRWHVDYLLLNPDFDLEYIIFGETSRQLECSLACALGGESVLGFGCSDCKCRSHLFYRATDPTEEIKKVFLKIVPEIDEKCLIICCI